MIVSDDQRALSSGALSTAGSNILVGLQINAAHWIIESSDLEISQHINSGSFGDVYRGVWKKTQEPVAIKTLKNAEALNLVAKEVNVLINVSHQYVLRFLGICTDPPLIVTELCEKGSVYHLLANARANPAVLPWQQRVRIALEAARGMMYLHAKEIYHRDLKSVNLLLAEDNKVKVADFGFARFVEGSHLTANSMPHNPRWLAPEIFVNQPFTKAADVYSFGMVLWEMLTCQVPFTKEYPGTMGNVQLICAIAKDSIRPEIPDSVTIPGCTAPLVADYVRLMKRCWAQDYRTRPDFAEVSEKLALLYQQSMQVASATEAVDRGFMSKASSRGNGTEVAWVDLEHLEIKMHDLEMLTCNKKWETGRRDKVYSGLWHMCEGEVSITVLEDNRGGPAQSVLYHEVLILQQLFHPNVQRIYGFFREEDALGLVTELCSKGTLRYLFDAIWWVEGCDGKLQADLQWPKKLRLAVQIAKAMTYVHMRSMIHGSLSSKSVLVDKDMRVVVSDFSSSIWTECEGGQQRVSPKLHPSYPHALDPRWVAPEVLKGEPRSKASDVYGFAILMWEMLTMQMPFANQNHLQVVHLVTNLGKRPEFEGVEGGMSGDFVHKGKYIKLMKRCWSDNVDQRPGFADIAKVLSDMAAM